MGIVNFFKNLNTNTLYFPGCLTKSVKKQEFENYKHIFDKLDIPYLLLGDEEVCCGAIAHYAGYRKEAKNLAEQNLEVFKKNKIDTIITNCASCYHFFKNIYPTMIRDFDITVKHTTEIILEALQKKRINHKGNKLEREPINYHDSCYLARHTGIIEEPREIIRRLGGEVLEYKKNGEETMCCGASAGFRTNFPEQAATIAQKRIEQTPNKKAKIVSACIQCHENLSRISEETEELSTFILRKLKEQKY